MRKPALKDNQTDLKASNVTPTLNFYSAKKDYPYLKALTRVDNIPIYQSPVTLVSTSTAISTQHTKTKTLAVEVSMKIIWFILIILIICCY